MILTRITDIPKTFTVGNQKYEVNLVDYIPGGSFGNFSSVRRELNVAKTIRYDDETVELTTEQILNTFWHELFHCFQFHLNNGHDETICQSFANFMREFECTIND